MLTSIRLDDHTRTEMHEVDDIGADGLLPSELLSFKAVGAKVIPEQLLGVGHVAAELSGECALIHPLSPTPLPRGERGS
ncbi:hypothetical protein BEN78_11285 [Xanthomonas citri pv. mangiferaeindicae]|nr:hypothetical protein BEN78_11285 [Xanthomonas citri pv. mangiferaeindicae]